MQMSITLPYGVKKPTRSSSVIRIRLVQQWSSSPTLLPAARPAAYYARRIVKESDEEEMKKKQASAVQAPSQ
jgi:hypothetical protein